jgi:hypothetical protein
MIWKVLKKIITAPLHIVEHSYKRAQQGFAYLTRRPGYVQYGPDAKVADGREWQREGRDKQGVIFCAAVNSPPVFLS